MLSLRLKRGVVYSDYMERFHLDGREIFAEPVSRLSQLGLLRGDDNGVCMTESGWAVADSLAGEFLLDDEI